MTTETEYDRIRDHIVEGGASLVEAAESANVKRLRKQGQAELADAMELLRVTACKIDELLKLDCDNLDDSLPNW